jgi:hypothetical protein
MIDYGLYRRSKELHNLPWSIISHFYMQLTVVICDKLNAVEIYTQKYITKYA